MMYDSFSQEYDRFVNWSNRLSAELPFLTHQILTAAGKPAKDIKVLDAATGTGMHAIALAKQGFQASGVDISEGMIYSARQNAVEFGADVFFEIAGFGKTADRLRSLSGGRGIPYDSVLCLGNSLPHVNNREELRSALDDFSACLQSGGLLILQNRNFDSVLARKDRWMEPQSYKEGNDEILYLRFYDFLPDGHIQFNILTLKHRLNDSWEQSVLETHLFPITRDDLVQELELAGFKEINTYGALANTPFDPDASGNLVVTAKKK